MCDVCVAENALSKEGFSLKIGKSTVEVRARGKGAEITPAEYQLRLVGEPWPRTWTKTKDLAGDMACFGFGVKYRSMPKEVKAWLLGKGPKPHVVDDGGEMKLSVARA